MRAYEAKQRRPDDEVCLAGLPAIDVMCFASLPVHLIERDEPTVNVLRRTLQRRLGELGLGFQSLVDDTRRALAEGYLKQPELSLAEVAYLLGFVEQASFFRAFRRWYGMTPQAYRKRPSPL